MRIAILAMIVLAGCVPPAAPGGASQDVSAAALLDQEWRLTNLEGSPSIKTRGDRQPHVRFMAGGKLEGFGSCNGFSGTYDLDGTKLRILSVAATKMACADSALNRQESRFFGALESTRSFSISGGKLTLRSADAELAKFEAAP